MTVLVDSDILIEVARGRNPIVERAWRSLSQSSHVVCCSPATVAELWHGARPNEHQSLRNLFAAIMCDPACAAVGELAGNFLRLYRKSHGLELGDALIAASAVILSAALWTGNRKHYPMPEVAFFDPSLAQPAPG